MSPRVPGLFQRVRSWLFGGPGRGTPLSRVDAASTNDENKRHWANADALGPNASIDPATRYRCRNRGRYEALNNGYCRGLVRSHAYDLVGSCPRLQLTNPGEDDAKTIERYYGRWARAVKKGRKLRTLEKGASRDGGGFLLADTNDRLPGPVKLDLRGVEDEQCQTPMEALVDPFTVDGIKFDEGGNPLFYYFLKYHPGESVALGLPGLSAGPSAYLTVPAERVIHWYEQDRFGQMRGLPRITAALPLFGQLRRFTLATLTAAEIAAMLAGVMKTNLPPASGSAVTVENWNLVELVRGALLSLPEGWDAHQFKPEHPTTTYGDFKREVLNETGRGSGAPLNIVSGNSSSYNFSSGRLDHLPYQRGVKIERYDLQDVALDCIFGWWLEEALMVPGYLPAGLPPAEEWAWSWNYDGFGSVDPTKDASAKDTRLKNGTATYADVLAEEGDDWQDYFDQLAREKAYAESRGLPWPLYGTAAPAQPAPDAPAQPDARHGIRAALEDAGLDEAKADETTDLLTAWISRGVPFSLNGGVK